MLVSLVCPSQKLEIAGMLFPMQPAYLTTVKYHIKQAQSLATSFKYVFNLWFYLASTIEIFQPTKNHPNYWHGGNLAPTTKVERSH